jgi:branched-chain amino acid transport system permease protein
LGTVLIGLALAMTLFLLSAGVTIIFGVLRIINFAHGAYFTLGAFLAYQTVHATGSFWLAIPAAVLVAGAIGAFQEIFTFRPIYKYPHAFQLIASLGFSLLMLSAIHGLWGLDYRSVRPPPSLASAIRIFGIDLSAYRIFVVVAGAAVSVLLLWVIDRTPVGLLIRAASGNSDMLQCLGINVARLRTGVLAAGSAMAALAGVIVAPLTPVQLEMGTTVLLDCFMVAVLAGLGSVRGAIIVSLVLGMCQAFGQLLFADWVEFLIYGVSLAFLLIRPAGLFGQDIRTA